jgi:hypothetical protein
MTPVSIKSKFFSLSLFTGTTNLGPWLSGPIWNPEWPQWSKILTVDSLYVTILSYILYNAKRCRARCPNLNTSANTYDSPFAVLDRQHRQNVTLQARLWRKNIALLSDLHFNFKHQRVQSQNCIDQRTSMSRGRKHQAIHSQNRKFGKTPRSTWLSASALSRRTALSAGRRNHNIAAGL